MGRVELGIFLVFLLSFLASILLTKLLIKFSFQLGFLDKPFGSLKKHQVATPILGGVAIFFSTLLPLCFFLEFKNFFRFFFLTSPFFFLGLFDDIKSLSYKFKLFFQVFFSFFLLYFSELYSLKIFYFFPLFIFILAVINSVNLVDVSDGLAGSTFFSVCIIASFLFYLFQASFPLLVSVSTSAAVLGFLFFNWPNAKIFMGDSGSLFLGSVLAFLVLNFNWTQAYGFGFFSPVIFLGVFLAEVINLTFIRLKKGISPFKGSNDHFSHYLKKKGFSKVLVIIFSVFSSLLLSFIAIALNLGFITFFKTIFLLVFSYIFWCFFVYKLKVKF